MPRTIDEARRWDLWWCYGGDNDKFHEGDHQCIIAFRGGDGGLVVVMTMAMVVLVMVAAKIY